MESDGWLIEKDRLKQRVEELQILLEQSLRREQQTAKLNNRLVEALNQISHQEDRNVSIQQTQKQFVEDMERLVMNKVKYSISRPSHRNIGSHKNSDQSLPQNYEYTTKNNRHLIGKDRSHIDLSPSISTLKQNRNSLNCKPIGIDKDQIRSMTAKLLKIRNLQQQRHF